MSDFEVFYRITLIKLDVTTPINAGVIGHTEYHTYTAQGISHLPTEYRDGIYTAEGASFADAEKAFFDDIGGFFDEIGGVYEEEEMFGHPTNGVYKKGEGFVFSNAPDWVVDGVNCELEIDKITRKK